MKKIVFIEDNRDVRETTQEILELADYKVHTAENGKQGVELVKAEKPDLVICDIMMPDLDGFGVLNILSKNPDTCGIPFVFLTAKSEKDDVRRGMNLGADDYLTKPFAEAELLEVIEMRLKKCEQVQKKYENTLEGIDEFIESARIQNGLENLSENRKVKVYKKKERIYREDDFANYLYYMVKGKVKCFKTDHYGKDLVTEIHGEGDFFGHMTLIEDKDYHESAVAMEDTEVAIIPKKDFVDLICVNRDVATSCTGARRKNAAAGIWFGKRKIGKSDHKNISESE